ncbi:uncharacterized protein LOC143248172 [Tachypleus tridentatus]|uniref:uncharacterized protein LOC143248172 n=1 Tax=Tachypleus tridentatus TaxID=6853 RepID=UPI003FD187CE
MRVWRRRGDQFSTCNIIQVDANGESSVMVWAGICLNGRTDLLSLDRGALNARRYRDEILEPIVRPFASAVSDGFILMQINARIHVARLCMDFLNEEGIETFDWPAKYPDIKVDYCKNRDNIEVLLQNRQNKP